MWGEANALGVSVYDVLDRWGVSGDHAEELLRKVMVLVGENAQVDRERMRKAEEAAKKKRPMP